MASGENAVQKASTKASTKQKVARWNRQLAWITLPMLIVSTILYYGPRQGFLDIARWPGDLTSTIFTLLFLVHASFSVYLFGFPKFRANIRIIHIYVGYVIFLFTLLSQSLIGVEPFHGIVFAINWLFIIVHVSLSLRFYFQRKQKKARDPELAFYTGGSLLRDATKK